MQGLNTEIVAVLRSQYIETEKMIRTYRGSFGNNRKRSDFIDQGKHEEGTNMNTLLIARLVKKSEDIVAIISELEQGWNCRCTYCGDVELSQNRIVEHLTMLCPDCRAELEENGKIH